MRRIIATAGVIAIAGLGFGGPASAAVEVEGLTEHLEFMVEEERLAHELYTLFAEEYPEASIFGSIARSEQRHMDAVARQLELRGLDDPGEGLEPGDYAVDELDDLYTTWSAEGLGSLEAALQVGIDLEEADIADLETALADPSTEPVTRLFSALLAGSRHHLQAFTAALEDDCNGCLGEPGQKMTAKREARGGGPGQGDRGRGHGNGRGDGWPPDADRYQKGTPRYPAVEPTD
ncbi:MAG: DUF2202 domain-containing protein [Actinomycetota bacterium]